MSRLIDLMPASCGARMRGRQTTRRWCLAYAAVIGTTALAWAGLRVGQIATLGERDRLLHEVALDIDYDRRLSELRERADAVRASIIRHERLSWPVRLSDVIGSLAEVVPGSVSLTSITVTPRLEAEKPGKQQGPPAALSLTLEATGVAPTDLDVAALMAGLEERGLFARVAMDHAREATIRGVRAREFGITCEIDLTSRRRRGTTPPADAEGGSK